jgi:hypothetical protein
VKINVRKRKPVNPPMNTIASVVTLEDLDTFVDDENNRKLNCVVEK